MSSIDPTAAPAPLEAPAPYVSPTGLFVTFEGGDGGGKSTQIQLAREWFEGSESPFPGARVTVTKEPGGTELGAKVRELILHSDHVDDRAEALLYAADRAHHVATKVSPALEAEGIVLADRYFDSSVAYQGAGRRLDVNDVEQLSLWAVQGLLPHVTILLDVDPGVLAQRRDTSTHDRLERAGLAFHEAVREAFMDRARTDPERWIVVDGSRSIDEVHEDIRTRLTDWLRSHDHMLKPPPKHPVMGAETDSLL